MKKLLLFCVSCLLCVTILLAQTREIKGIVTDSKGIPLEGASVVSKGTGKGLKTNTKGEFTIHPKAGNEPVLLTISYVGFKTQLIEVKGNELLNIKLEIAEVSAGDEVVVIGYQTMKRKDIPGGIASIGAKDLKDVVVASAEEAITGKLAGVQVTTSEGAPGSQVQIRVRGGGSITQDNSPLYIIDGIESDEGISLIAPQDIESIDVLKDASATSIYGARAANGVVVVTTKSGKNSKGKMTLSYNGSFGLNKLSKELPVMDPYNFVLYQYERSKYSDSTSTQYTWDSVKYYKNNVPFFDWQKKMFGRNALQQTHNVSLSGGNAQTQYYLSVTDNTQDGIYLNSEYDRKLITFKLDNKPNDKVKLGFNVRYNTTTVEGAGTTDPNGDQSMSKLRGIIRYKPFIQSGQSADAFDPTLEAATGGNGLILINPVLTANQSYLHTVTDNFVLSGFLNYQLTSRISFRTTFGYDISDVQKNGFNDTLTGYAIRYGAKMPSASIERDKKVILNNSNVFTYTGKSTANPFTILLGQETYKNVYDVNVNQTSYMPIGIDPKTALANMNMSTPPDVYHPGFTATSLETPTNLVSFFTKINYNLNRKYQFTASYRADGASVFAKKWGYFSSAGLSWLLSKEKFMDNFNVLSDIKVRASIGMVGNAKIASGLYEVNYTSSNPASSYALDGVLNPGLNSANLANRDLQWESTLSRNLGFDFGIFRNKFQVSVDLYANTTNKLLVNVPIPVSSGYTTQVQNVGSTLNKGIELQLAGTVLRTRDFTWSFTYNISANDNTIKSLGANQNFYYQSSNWAGASNLPDYIVQVGQRVGSMYGFVSDGFYSVNDFTFTKTTGSLTSDGKQLGTYTLRPGVATNTSITSSPVQPGSIKFKDLNGDGVVDARDRKILGNNQPKAFGGLTQTFKYKNWDASIFLNYRIGGSIVNDNKLEYASGYTPQANMLAEMENRWKVVNPVNGVTYQNYSPGNKTIVGVDPTTLAAFNQGASIWLPSIGSSSSAFTPSSYALEDGSFLRVNNITIGYALPVTASIMRKTGLTRFRIYATVNNVAILTSYSGFDPEVNTKRATPLTPGVDYSAYPRSRGYVCGINLNF